MYKEEIDEYIQNERLKNKQLAKKISVMAILIFFIVAVLANFVFLSGVVLSESMEDTLMVNERFVGNRLYYKLGNTPQRFDVVVFRAPDDNNHLMVKRIIGVGGDTVQIKDGELLINGVVTEEPYLKEKMLGHFGPYKVPEGSYLLLGDNRNRSSDARAWQHTFVTIDNIRAKATFVFRPKKNILLNGGYYASK